MPTKNIIQCDNPPQTLFSAVFLQGHALTYEEKTSIIDKLLNLLPGKKSLNVLTKHFLIPNVKRKIVY
jgi:hypothetical protein